MSPSLKGQLEIIQQKKPIAMWMIPASLVVLAVLGVGLYVLLSELRTPPITPPLEGSRIAYASARENNYVIYVMKADGSQPTPLTRHSVNNYLPIWSPDGTQIAFISVRGESKPEIHLINADGSNERLLVRDATGFSWSPDGTRIAYNTFLGGDIYVVNADGSRPRRLTTGSEHYTSPMWSPDGTHIAFHSIAGVVMNINIIDADGSNLTLLTTSGSNWFMSWSPDGEQMVYGSLLSGTLVDGIAEIYIVDADASNRKQLTTTSSINTSPSWSPDGKQIAFTSYRDGNAEIYIMSADGSRQTRLTDSPGEDYGSIWSPDGKQIAFTSDRDGNIEIYSMNPDGSKQVRLTNHPDPDNFPAWSPDR